MNARACGWTKGSKGIIHKTPSTYSTVRCWHDMSVKRSGPGDFITPLRIPMAGDQTIGIGRAKQRALAPAPGLIPRTARRKDALFISDLRCVARQGRDQDADRGSAGSLGVWIR